MLIMHFKKKSPKLKFGTQNKNKILTLGYERYKKLHIS